MNRRKARWFRDPARQARLARILWIVFAVVIWNVVFDRVLVLAGREYVYAAALAARDGVYLFAKDWMASAVARGFWLASAGAALILAAGLALVSLASKRPAEPEP
jgi:hypothetical protein